MISKSIISSSLNFSIISSNPENLIKLVKSLKIINTYLPSSHYYFILNGYKYDEDTLHSMEDLIDEVVDNYEIIYLTFEEILDKYTAGYRDMKYFQFLKLRLLSYSDILDNKYVYIMDDDMEFLPETDKSINPGLQLLNGLRYMEEFPQCGLLSGVGSLYLKRLTKYGIGASSYNASWIGKGILARVDGAIPPLEILEKQAGGCEDGFYNYEVVSNDMFCGILPNFRLVHRYGPKTNLYDYENKKWLGWFSEEVVNHTIFGANTLKKKFYNCDYDMMCKNPEDGYNWYKNVGKIISKRLQQNTGIVENDPRCYKNYEEDNI